MKINNLTLWFWNKIVLENVNLDIPLWDFVFFIGYSWSWKTSLIRSLIWDFKPFSWDIILDDGAMLYQNFQDKFIWKYRRKIWVIFQDYKLLESKTVYENVAFAMEVCSYKDEDIRSKVPEVLWQVWLLLKKDKYITELSGWERQRVSIARALVHDPDLIIWDEPTWNLDPITALNIMELFVELNKIWKTVIIATHDANIVNNFNKRVITFKDNKVFSDIQKWKYNL